MCHGRRKRLTTIYTVEESCKDHVCNSVEKTCNAKVCPTSALIKAPTAAPTAAPTEEEHDHLWLDIRFLLIVMVMGLLALVVVMEFRRQGEGRQPALRWREQRQ